MVSTADATAVRHDDACPVPGYANSMAMLYMFMPDQAITKFNSAVT